MHKFTSLRETPPDKHDVEDHREYEIQDVSTVPPLISLAAVIDRTLMKLNEDGVQSRMQPPRDSGPRAKFVIHPSSSAGCPLAVALNTLGADQDRGNLSPRLLRIFDNGHAFHMRMQGLLFQAAEHNILGLTAAWEDVDIEYPSLCIKGELDQIVEAGEHRYVVEYKSSNATIFDRLRSPKKEWIWQVYCYMAATNLRGAIVVVECKNTQRIKEYYVPWEESVWEEISKALKSILRTLQQNKLPQEKDTSQCFFCSYVKYCDYKSRNPQPVDVGALAQYIDFPTDL